MKLKIIQHVQVSRRPSVGRAMKSSKGGYVFIEDGCYLDPVYGRVSNFWSWRKINKDGTLGRLEQGYGYEI